MKKILSVLVSLIFLASFFSLPIWKKNAFIIKQKEKRELIATRDLLLQENTLLDYRLHALTKPAHIEKLAKAELGLVWDSRPWEVVLP